ncbi:MAG: RHS repeat-associated core domain-containing protein [Actinobacteria bacterium]|nr:RHS repeat-associated core domain-containing protein [Actinomycetota bacterium]MCL6104213.1 RHS repeat-associated core domain-containing protein [Actinomycetota bacterium]
MTTTKFATYLYSDPEGVRFTFNSSGNLTGEATYNAYGNVTSGGVSSITPFSYAGGYTDPTGLIYLIHRYYDSVTGQFTSVDPLVAISGQPYVYAGGDPVNGSDPSGLWGWNPISDVTQAWNDTGGKVAHAVATHTIGLCLNLSAGWGPYGTVSGCVALSGGHPTFVGTVGGGGSSPTASVTLGLLLSNAKRPSDLRGLFAGGGGSADFGLSVGDEGAVGTNSCNQAIWQNQFTAGLGLDLPIPFEGHGGATYTWTWSP